MEQFRNRSGNKAKQRILKNLLKCIYLQMHSTAVTTEQFVRI